MFISLQRVYSGITIRIIITLHFRHGRTASNVYFAVGRWEVGNHNMWLGSLWYVNTQVVVPCALHIFLVHTKLHTNKTFPIAHSIPPFVFPVGACFQHVFTRPCETRRWPMKDKSDNSWGMVIVSISIHLPLDSGPVLFYVEGKPWINHRLIKNKIVIVNTKTLIW